MSANRKAAWSPGAAGPVLSIAGAADPRDRTWRDDAACLGTDTDAFYPETGSSLKMARKVCARCPVTRQCLEEALSQPFTADFGLWGGTTKEQRERIRRARKLEAA